MKARETSVCVEWLNAACGRPLLTIVGRRDAVVARRGDRDAIQMFGRSDRENMESLLPDVGRRRVLGAGANRLLLPTTLSTTVAIHKIQLKHDQYSDTMSTTGFRHEEAH